MSMQSDPSRGKFSAHRVAGAIVGFILLGYVALTVAQVAHSYVL